LRAEDGCQTGTRRRKTFRKGCPDRRWKTLGGTGKVAAFAAMEDMLVSNPEINYKTDGRSLQFLTQVDPSLNVFFQFFNFSF
jgi:hypothetical protein